MSGCPEIAEEVLPWMILPVPDIANPRQTPDGPGREIGLLRRSVQSQAESGLPTQLILSPSAV
jgi:hypothetical protein